MSTSYYQEKGADMIQQIGYWIMRLFRDRAKDCWYHDNPNHRRVFKWSPYPDELQEYYCCVLNS